MKRTAAKAIFLCALVLLIVLSIYAYRVARSGIPVAPTLRGRQAHRTQVMPVGSLPKVEPMAYLPIAADEAMAVNAAEAEVSDPGPAAKPFFIQSDNREAATHCLTSAIYYEAASDGVDGERAVAQVVLNRARHPAFPPSICGVIYQGAERKTGCQFTFSCDGSLARAPSKTAWAFAQRIATAALSGYVYAPVGLATHYHTNKVVPYWASNLTFSNLVKTQLFYRWRGGFGTPSAFTRRRLGPEIDVVAFNEKWKADVSGIADVLVWTDPALDDPLKGHGINTNSSNIIPQTPSKLKVDTDTGHVLNVDKQEYILLNDRTGKIAKPITNRAISDQ